jgi:hypothetical protein
MITTEEIINKIRSKKNEIKKFGIKNIGLFGSFSKNIHTEKSDIDILIDFEKERESFDNFMGVYDLLENLFNNNKVEVVTKNGLSPHIGKYILNDVIYV